MTVKTSLKDYLNDDTLDLSVNDLQEVPVKEIAAITKATNLDLSSNKIQSLSDNFATSLTRLVKLDLCRNQLTQLPENFGLLVHLKQLDLYMNKLTTLPLSFGNLKALRWLDLKDNPLVPKMASIVGPCADTIQCQSAAKKTVAFLADMQKKVEEEKKRRLKLRMLQEEKENQSEQKYDKRKKKKKKAKQGETKEVQENEWNHLAETTEDGDLTQSESEPKNTRVTSGKVSRFLSRFLKSVIVIVSLLLLTLFIINLIHEPTYKIIIAQKNQLVEIVAAQMPESVLARFHQTSVLVKKYGEKLLRNTISLCYFAFVKMLECYTDEQVQFYVETFKNYCHVIYIEMCELITKLSNAISSYLQS